MSVSLEISSVPTPWHREPNHEARSRLLVGPAICPSLESRGIWELNVAAGRAGFHAAFPMGRVQSPSLPGSGLVQSLWHEGRCWDHSCARSWCWEKEEHVPAASLWISSLSACGSSSSLPVVLALLPTGLTHLHGSDSLRLAAVTRLPGSDPCLPMGLIPLYPRICSLSS